MIHVTPWSPLVTEADAGKFWNTNPGHCPHCAAPIGSHHASTNSVECWVLRHRRNQRHGWIAFLHLKAKNGDMGNPMTAERDRLIAELRDDMEYDRPVLMGWIDYHREHTLVRS